jgi:FeS assembly SUF system regulator
MLKLSRLTDYGTVVLAHLARDPGLRLSATELAQATHLGEPTVRKLLKMLARGGIVVSHRGAQGGYALARPPEAISAVEIIDALEGPVALTECSGEHSACEHERNCALNHNWPSINAAVRDALQAVTLAHLARPAADAAVAIAPLRFHPRPARRED